MINLFKTHYSIGKSILTPEEDGDKSVFTIAKNLDLKEIFLLEDSMSGFAEAYFNAEKAGIPIRYGVTLKHGESKEGSSNFCVFALNTQGYKDLVKLVSTAETKEKNKLLSSSEIKDLWTENLWMAIPFYDSFLHKNLLEGKQCIFDLSLKPTLFIEDNDHPFDFVLKPKVEKLAKSEGLETLEVQTCLYPDPSYFDAWATFKAMHKRGYRQPTLDAPNLDHCPSTNFYAK